MISSTGRPDRGPRCAAGPRSAWMSTNRMVRPQPKAVQLHGADLGQHLDQPVLHDLKAHQGLAELRLASTRFASGNASHTGAVATTCRLRGAWQHLQAPLTSDVPLGLHLTQPPDIRRIPLARFAHECGRACSLRTSSATASPVPVGALQDRHLVPQRKDLHILVAVAHRQQAYERERVRQGEIGQSQHGRSSSPKGSGPAVRVSSWKVPLARAAGTIRPLTYADELSAPAGCLAWSASSGTRRLTP